MTLRDMVLLALCNLVWGLNAIAVKLSVEAVEPMTAACLRFAILFVACLPFLRWLPGRMGMVVLASLVNGAFYLALINLSFAAAYNVSALAVVQQLSIPFSLLLAVVFLKERIRWVRILGVLVSFVGVLVMSFDPAIADERLALFLAVLSSLLFAAGALLLRQLKGVPPLAIYAWLSLISMPCLLLLSLVVEPGELRRSITLPVAALSPIVFSALASSLIGQVSMASLLQRYPVSTISPLTLPAPLIAIFSTAWYFDVGFTIRMIVGGLLVLAGVAVITLRSAQLRERREASA